MHNPLAVSEWWKPWEREASQSHRIDVQATGYVSVSNYNNGMIDECMYGRMDAGSCLLCVLFLPYMGEAIGTLRMEYSYMEKINEIEMYN